MKRFTPIQTRREFLNQVGRGMVTAAIGYNVARELSLAPLLATEVEGRLHFGALEPLVNLMQETSSAKLLPLLVEKLRTGTQLKELVAAAAFANARTFGGEDYVGYHTMMALAPGFHMAQELPASEQPLPVLKVLYRNTRRIEEKGPAQGDVLRPIEAAAQPAGSESGAWFRDAVHTKDATRAEAALAAIAGRDIDEAFNALLYAVHDDTEVHRTVLPYRAWDLAGLIGREQALTLLRQSVRYCVSAESWSGRAERDEPRALLPKLLEEHKLLSKTPGTRLLDDGAVEEMSMLLFRSTPQEAAAAAAAALADGIAPDAIGEAISLAANQLVLRDHGRKPPEESPGKPIGSVHGDSIGVHASDSANAWRSMARQTSPRNTFACLLLGAYQVSRDRIARGGDFLKWEPLPLQRHVDSIKAKSAEDLLRELDESIRANLQARASAVVARYAQEGGNAPPVFDLLRRYAISEDGALHAEKYFRTVTEEFRSTRPTKRWRHLIGLARVTASEFGRPAAGVAEARALLGV